QIAVGYRAAATTPLESEDRSRSFHDLFEMSRERFKASLFFRSRAGPGFGALAKLRTNSCPTYWNFHARKEMGATQSKYRCHVGYVARAGGAVRCNRLEKRLSPAARNTWNRGPTV